MSTETGGAGAAPAPSFDSLFEKHFEGDGIDGLGDTGDDAATPADHDDEALFEDGDDTPDGRGSAGDGDTDDDEWNDEEGGNEEGDDEDETDTDDQEEDPDQRGRAGKGAKTGKSPEESGDSFFDRKEIDQIQDPEAKKVAQRAYASMQKAFVQKTSKLAEERKGWEAKVEEADGYRAEYEGFVQEIGSNEGAEQFLHLVIDSRPHVFTESVLVALALKQPQVFDAAVERYQQLAQDDDARSTFEDKIEVKRGKYEGQQRDKAHRRTEAATQQQRLTQAVTTRAATHKVTDPDSLQIIQDQVALMVQRNRAAQKRTTLEDVHSVVDRVSGRLVKTRQAGRDEGERSGRKRRQDDVREQAKRAKDRRPAPTGRRAPADKGGEYKPPAERGESSRALVDHFFGE
jgi:hypothetical protein